MNLRRRPVRIPERISLLRAEPDTALAGEKSIWTLRFEMAEDVGPGEPLALQLHGGRNNPGSFELPKDSALNALTDEGTPLTVRRGRAAGILELEVPGTGLPKGTKLTVTLGNAAAPTVSLFNKFFVLFRRGRETRGGNDWQAKQRENVWNDETQKMMVGACAMDVLGNDIDHVRAYVPSQTAPGESIAVLVRPEDRYSNLSHEGLGDLEITLDGKRLKARTESVPDSTCVVLGIESPGEGVHRFVVRDVSRGLETVTNPAICSAADVRRNVYWGMIHGHTEMSDGTGTIERYLHQLRNEAGLDFGAPGDHDHLYETSDAMWKRTSEVIREWNEPGRFVTFLGYEWAKWRQNGDGDRNVYYLQDDRPLYRSDDECHPAPPDLFEALKNEEAIVIPHHTGHIGNWCDWKDHDPRVERLVEIFQLRGGYESAEGSPAPQRWTYDGKSEPVPEGMVDRALAMGWRVGFTAGGDDHIGHAGTDYPFPASGYKAGLTSVLATGLTREEVWDTLYNRRVVATTGPRILLDYNLNGRPMGSELSEAAETREIRIEFHGTAPAARIEIIRNNKVVYAFEEPGLDGELAWDDEAPLADVLLPAAEFCGHPFCFYYVRLVQEDDEVAWASPVWIDPE